MRTPRRWARGAGLLAAGVLASAGSVGAQQRFMVFDPEGALVLNEGDGASVSRTLEVKLDGSPEATTTISVGLSDNYFGASGVTVSPSSLTFRAANWNSAQTLTFTAAEDADRLDGRTLVHMNSDDGNTVGHYRFGVFVHDDEETLVTSAGAGPSDATPPEVLEDSEALYQGFTTGEDEYSLRSVEMVLTASSTRGKILSFKLWPEDSGAAGKPDLDATPIDLGTHDVEIGYANRPQGWAFPGVPWSYAARPHVPVRLDASTTYFIGITIESSEGSKITWMRPSCSALTGSLGLSDWSVAAESWEWDGTSFTERCRVRMRIGGTPLDDPPLILSRRTLALNEGGTGTFEVALTAAPSSTVTVAAASGRTAAATVSPSSLTFTTSNWSTAQTVTVTGVQDTNEHDENVGVALSGTGVLSDVVAVRVVDDDNNRAFVFTPPALDLDEGGTAGMYTVALRSQPGSTLTVTVASSDAAAATVSPSSLTFTTSNWNTAQTVTVSPVADNDATNEFVAISHAPSLENPPKTNVAVAVDDDDWLTVRFVFSTLAVAEDVSGGVAAAAVAIYDAADAPTMVGHPLGGIVVEARARSSDRAVVRPDSGTDYTLVDETLLFRAADEVKSAETTIHDDAQVEFDEVFELALGWEGGRPVLPDREVRLSGTTLAYTIEDDDDGTYDFGRAAYEVTEGETIDVVLSLSAPVGPELSYSVSLGTSIRSDAELVVTDSATQTLASSWRMNVVLPAGASGAQSAVRVRAPSDDTVDPDRTSILFVTFGPGIRPPGLTVGSNLGINGQVDLTVKQSPNAAPTGAPSVSGAGRLGSMLTGGKGTVSDGDGLPADDAELNWQWVRQDDVAGTGAVDIGSATGTTYTLAAADDGKFIVLKMSYTDGAGYSEEVASAVVGPVGDEDFDIAPQSVRVDEGVAGVFEVALSSEPSASVTVSLTSADPAAVSVSPSSLAFTTSNWNAARTVTVRGVQDNDSTNEEVAVTLAASGGGYAGVTGTVTVTVEDDEVPGLVMEPGVVEVTEGESSTYRVRLTVLPQASVTVSLSSPVETGAAAWDPLSLTFTTANWDTAQTVTVDGLEDGDLDHESVAVTHAASGSSEYASVSETLTVTVEDDDLLDWGDEDRLFLVVNEGRPVEREVKLVSQPPSSVAVSADSGNAALEVSPSTLAFTTANWDTAQTLTFTAREDADASDFTRTVIFEGAGVTQALPVQVHDDEGTLASSFAEGPVSPLNHNAPAAFAFGAWAQRAFQGFTAGPHGQGYTLRSVSLALVASDTDSEPFSDVTVTLVPATRTGEPDVAAAGTTLGAITGADLMFGRSALHELRFPAVRLEANETYFVSISNQAAHSGDSTQFDCAAGGGEIGHAGWSIADASVDDQNGTLQSDSCVLLLRLGGGEWMPPPPPGGGPPPSGPPPPDDEDDDEDEDGGGGFTPPRAAIGTDAACADGLCRALTGAPVRFEDMSTGSVQRRSWDFGSGSSRSALVNWSWPSPGFFEVTLRVSSGAHESTASLVFLVEAASPAGTCVAGEETRCLLDSRFSVDAEWWTAPGENGAGRVVRRGSNDSALFSFFDAGNWEMVVKVLDGCALNGHVWVFGASATDLGYRVTVTDTVTGTAREYRNEPGTRAEAIADVAAFPQACATPE